MPIETINLSEPKFENYLRSFTNQNWILCVGAGICKGILPDWSDLTLGLVNSTFSKSWSKDEFKKSTDEVGFSLDNWIQSCYNKLISQGKSLDDFNKLLQYNLYNTLLLKAETYGLKNDLILSFESPKKLKRKKIFQLCEFFENNYGHTTLIQVIQALVYHEKDTKLPSAIITFNADSLLHSLIVLFSIKKHFQETGEYHFPKEEYRKVTRTFQSWANSVPIFHLHGSISPTEGVGVERDSRDNLIFIENSYNEVASSMYSWAQSTFLYSAQNSKLVFLGLSMSDPNIRRWLSWTNQLYVRELSDITKSKATALPHLWIKTKSTSDDIQEFMDISLRHMGVKIGLLENWSKVKETLTKIM